MKILNSRGSIINGAFNITSSFLSLFFDEFMESAKIVGPSTNDIPIPKVGKSKVAQAKRAKKKRKYRKAK